MTEEDRYKITSDDYADILLEGVERINSFRNKSDCSMNFIDGKFAVCYIPVNNMTYDSVPKFGYQYIPKCYGLLSPPSLEDSGVNKLRMIPNYNLKGQGVLVGFIDTGIDYMNSVFRYADQTSRIVSIWDQNIESDKYPKDFYYGTEYDQSDINLALIAVNPLSIVPSVDENGHGTMLAGVAAGSSNEENDFSGVATDSEIVVVKLKPAKPYLKDYFRIPEGALCYQENDIMSGINYLLSVADRLKRPIAICIGVGTSQGAHEGDSILCQYINDIGQINGYSIVVAGGNEGNERHHFYGEINPNTEFDIVGLNVGENEKGFSMELWGYAPNIVEVNIYAPSGEFVASIPSGFLQRGTVTVNYNEVSIFIDNQFSEEVTGNQLILFRFSNPIRGLWRFVISGRGDLSLRYHIWLPIDNFLSSNTYFINANSDTTLSIPANAMNAISVTSYNHLNQSLYYYASRGFTKSLGLKPDIAAPGINIVSPAIDGDFFLYTGSSAAAAHTTGIAALILEWGIIKGNFTALNNIVLRRMLISGARRNPNVTYPNQAWGFGVLDIYRTFQVFYEEANF